MSYSLSDQRKNTMLERLGDAAQLIDDKRFLPFYRSIQIKLEREDKAAEWLHMIEIALTKENPSRYFAKMCKMVKDGTYKFVEKVKEVQADLRLYVHDKLVKYQFGKFQKYWVRKAQEFINVNGQAGFVDLLEYAERTGINQKQMATALKNCKSPRQYYQENVLGSAK
ncbi:hypothetical protein [Polynucleobacter sp.]|uniref:hypothetical protein n=1 Tax=Polynucleobacter sp. TaxID=2029855 RepID=UPI003F69C1B2